MTAEIDKCTLPVIAIDGPSGSGKGTLSSLLAQRLGWNLLDSGALYRIVALMAARAGLIFNQDSTMEEALAIAKLTASLSIRFLGQKVFVNSLEVTDEIRREDVSIGASIVATFSPVRKEILGLQRAMQDSPGLIADGRDMGTVVFPNAELKVFLDASAKARADRRYKQLKNKGLDVKLPDLLASIKERDERDRGRSESPLIPADDAVVIDSTGLTVEQVLEQVCLEGKSRGLF
ncbi:MAG: cytidylate kinase [Gammaproteobacteria bacterium]|nr:cytidylate kinase [Gammaproteobacteria bacterium]